MAITKAQQAAAINQILMDEVQKALAARRSRGPIAEAIRGGTDDELDTYSLTNGLAMKLQEHWQSTYNEGDPSMAALGKEEWDAQCDVAAEKIRDEVAAIIDDVEQQLIGGEFHYAQDRLPRS